MLSLSMMAYPPSLQHTRGMARLFMLLAIKRVCMSGLRGCCIFEGNIQALTACGGAEHTDGHVIAVKLGRGGAAPTSPSQRRLATVLKPRWLEGNISATLTAACQRQTALRWHWPVPPLHPRTQRRSPAVSPGPAVTLSHNTCLTLAGSLFHG